mmetsp:Transcript_127773/g.367811  ORF Transcript_127773/g.367811 Transcript_127773/m.367811 type:complete len:492 (-) Transcript_127773:137-1612(-)
MVGAGVEELAVAALFLVLPLRKEDGDALLRQALGHLGKRLDRQFLHLRLHVARGVRGDEVREQRDLVVRLGLSDPACHLFDALWLVVDVEALGVPERGVAQHVQRLQGVPGVEAVHLADDDLPDARGRQPVWIVFGEAQLDHDVRGELQRQALVAEAVCDPSDLGHVLRAHHRKVLHHSERDLVSLPRGSHVAGNLGQPAGVSPEHHRHGAWDRWVVDELSHLLHTELTLAARVVLGHEFFRQLALQRCHLIHVCHLVQVLRIDPAVIVGVKKAEGLYEHLFLVLPLAVQLPHDLVKQLLHLVQGNGEHLNAALDLVAELHDPLLDLLEGWPELVHDHLEGMSHLVHDCDQHVVDGFHDDRRQSGQQLGLVPCAIDRDYGLSLLQQRIGVEALPLDERQVGLVVHGLIRHVPGQRQHAVQRILHEGHMLHAIEQHPGDVFHDKIKISLQGLGDVDANFRPTASGRANLVHDCSSFQIANQHEGLARQRADD